MAHIEKTFKVIRKSSFLEELDKLAKKYKFVYDIFEAETVESRWLDDFGQEFKYTYFPLTVYLNFSDFKIDGYDYLGCVKDFDMVGLMSIHGNQFAKEAGISLSDFVKQFDDIPCHACKRKHQRKIGHIFQKIDTKELQVYGSGCAKKYFGIDFFQLLSRFESTTTKLQDEIDESFRLFCKNVLNLDRFGAIVYHSINNYGWKSASSCFNMDDISTADDSKTKYFDWNNLNKQLKDQISAIDFQISSLLVDLVDGKVEGLNDFEHNVVTTQDKIKLGLVTLRDMGMIAYLVYVVHFKKPVEEKSKKTYNNNPPYQVGDKIKGLDLEIINKSGYDGAFSWVNIYTLTDGDCQFKWFTNNEIGPEENWSGAMVHFKSGTVKKIDDHPTYGVSVVLTRCRTIEIETEGT